MKIKNWDEYQHYRHRNPPWIKLHKRLLDDLDWHTLSGDDSKMLAMCWLIASESNDGSLPPIEKLAFRLRKSTEEISSFIRRMDHWISFDASDMLAPCLQDASNMLLQSRVEKEKRRDITTVRKSGAGNGSYPPGFSELWKINPYGSKQEALKEYLAVRKKLGDSMPSDTDLATTLSRQKAEAGFAERDGAPLRPLPHLCRWFKKHRWEDEPYQPALQAPDEDSEFMREYKKLSGGS